MGWGQGKEGQSLRDTDPSPFTERKTECGSLPCYSLIPPDEIMSQFPSSKMAEGEEKEDQCEDKSTPTV